MDCVIEQTTHRFLGSMRFTRDDRTKWYSLADVNRALHKDNHNSKKYISRYELESYIKVVPYKGTRKLKMINCEGLEKLLSVIPSSRIYDMYAWLFTGDRK